MLSYISSTRKKSCLRCVKAKRRCDLGYPFCKRCFVKGFDCKYPNPEKAPVHDPVVIRQSTPDFNLPTTSDAVIDIPPSTVSVLGPKDPSLGLQFARCDFGAPAVPPSESSESSEDIVSNHAPFSDGNWMGTWKQDVLAMRKRMAANSRICGEIGSNRVTPCFLERPQVSSIVSNFLSFIPELAHTGATPFLHRALYQNNQPSAYLDCVAISGLYLIKNPQNQALLGNIINAKVAGLIAASKDWTLEEHLAAVQALIIYQFIRLFDTELQIQEQSERHNELLERWTAHLWKRFYANFQNSKDTYEHWVFNESVRRTIIMSIFCRCGYTCFTKEGLATQVHALIGLPLTKDFQSWECGPDEWHQRNLSYITEEENLIRYKDMMFSWTEDQSVESLGRFPRMLLSACRGIDDPRLLFGWRGPCENGNY